MMSPHLAGGNSNVTNTGRQQLFLFSGREVMADLFFGAEAKFSTCMVHAVRQRLKVFNHSEVSWCWKATKTHLSKADLLTF